MSLGMEKITLTIPEGSRIIEDIWVNIEKIVIPNSVVKISEYAFYGCESLKEIVIPDSVKYIDKYAFKGCTSLKSISIPDGVIYIGDCAFMGCSALTELTIPNIISLTAGVNTFWGCDSLKSLYINKKKGSLDLSRAKLPEKCKVFWKGEF